jgi:hypothetical protein
MDLQGSASATIPLQILWRFGTKFEFEIAWRNWIEDPQTELGRWLGVYGDDAHLLAADEQRQPRHGQDNALLASLRWHERGKEHEDAVWSARSALGVLWRHGMKEGEG